MTEQGSDPSVQAARERISAIDAELVALLNQRLELVRELHAYKRAQGYPDGRPGARDAPARRARRRRIPGPIADDELRALWADLLALQTREAARLLDEAG